MPRRTAKRARSSQQTYYGGVPVYGAFYGGYQYPHYAQHPFAQVTPYAYGYTGYMQGITCNQCYTGYSPVYGQPSVQGTYAAGTYAASPYAAPQQQTQQQKGGYGYGYSGYSTASTAFSSAAPSGHATLAGATPVVVNAAQDLPGALAQAAGEEMPSPARPRHRRETIDPVTGERRGLRRHRSTERSAERIGELAASGDLAPAEDAARSRRRRRSKEKTPEEGYQRVHRTKSPSVPPAGQLSGQYDTRSPSIGMHGERVYYQDRTGYEEGIDQSPQRGGQGVFENVHLRPVGQSDRR